MVDGKIVIDHDGFPSPGAGNPDVLVDDPDTQLDERMTASVTVAPKPAGDHFVDSADTKMTASLYYVETGKKDVTAGNDVNGDGMVDADEKDDGIDQTKRFLERNVSGGVTTYPEFRSR